MDQGEPTSSGTLTGEITAGGRRLQFGSIHGAAVVAADGAPPFAPRPLPVSLRPPAPALVDREVEIAELTSSLGTGKVVQLVGEHGTGRTALLLSLAHSAPATVAPDGVVVIEARGRAREDVIDAVFAAFVASNARAKATPDEVRAALADKRALVIVDDLELDPEDAAAVLELLPEAATVVATTPGVPIRGAKVVPVGGLPEDAACAYVARLLGQDLDERGAAGVAAVAGAVGGYPLRLRQALALARGSPVGLTAIAESLAGEDDRALARQALGALSEPEQRVVASLALPHRAPVHARHLSALCGVADAEEIARRLAGAGIIVADGNGVRLADDVAAEVEASWPLGTPRAVALGYLTGWAESNRRSPEAVAEESRALVGLAHWAVGAERHRETLRLAWAAESSLALAGAWGDWGRLLDAALRAAQVLGDRSAESWAVHEQGVRSLCLDDAPAARELLGRALSLRDQAGDDDAAEATRQVLATAPAGRGRRTARTAGGGRRSGTGGGGPRLPADARARLLLVAATIAIAAIVVAIVVATRGGDDETATETTPAPATPPPSPPETDTVLPPVVPSEPETVVEPPPTPPGGRIPANVRVAGPPIQEGSTGQRVRQLQRGLRALGYEPGTIDGAYGPATRQAIIEFQEDNQIEADGIAGRATLRAVNARLQELRDQAAAGTG